MMDYNASYVANSLGLSYSDYNWLMGLNGSLMGFVVVFFSVMLVLNIAKGR